jgi:hypothetical protein
MGQALGAGGTLAGQIPVVGQALKDVADFDKTLIDSTDKLKRWGDELHEGNTRFADFSAALAQVSARQLMRDVRYNQGRGNARAESAERLAEAKSNLAVSTAPFQDAWANFKNDFGADVLKLLKDGVDLVKQVASLIPGVREWLAKRENERLEGMLKWQDQLDRAAAKWEAYIGRPPRFGEQPLGR